MANAKNTIQNIPLTGNLNLNKLKTDVAPFEGYNDKNSTVFGGELTNIHIKNSHLGYKNNTYDIFNSKGERFTIRYELNGSAYLYNGDTLISSHMRVPLIKDDYDLQDDTVWFAHVTSETRGSHIFQLCLTSDFSLYGRFYNDPRTIKNRVWRYLSDVGTSSTSMDNVVAANACFFEVGSGASQRGVLVFTYIEDIGSRYRCHYYMLYDFDTYNMSATINTQKKITGTFYLPTPIGSSIRWDSLPIVTISKIIGSTLQGSKVFISGVPYLGKWEIGSDVGGDPTVQILKISFDENTSPVTTSVNKHYYYSDRSTITSTEETNENGSHTNYIKLQPGQGGIDQYGLLYRFGGQYYQETVEITPNKSYLLFKGPDGYPLYSLGTWWGFTGHDGNYFLPGIREGNYLNGILYAYECDTKLLEEPGVIKAPYYNISGSASFTYKNPKGKWVVCTGTSCRNFSEWSSYKDKVIINNRYILLGFWNNYVAYDIETKEFIDNDISTLGYIFCGIPYYEYDANSHPDNLTGIIYADGENANYTISKNPFTGLLMNPNVMTGFPKVIRRKFKILDGTYMRFYTIGDTAQSAKYHGKDPEYFNTVYPIDTNGNIIYPITWNSNIIKGYSNNDLIQNSDTTYPMIYWSPNQNIFAYYALSAMSNIKGAFALQGQQYTFDDANIYNVQFANGIIQSSQSICYIENMQYLGTLPTSAIFYSKYNKTFYKFTGDSILSKMFEANDIDEIRMVGQNPSTQSLWICTDKGIYILSDTDMFKLGYQPYNIFFNYQKTILISEGTNNWEETDISLYDIGNDAEVQPIKFKTKYYGLGGEHKALYDCWYIRLHSAEKREGKITAKMNTITDTSFASNIETKYIEKSMYDENNQIYLKFQPKYQSGVAVQLELESDIPIYQISLGANVTDQVTQQAKFNF